MQASFDKLEEIKNSYARVQLPQGVRWQRMPLNPEYDPKHVKVTTTTPRHSYVAYITEMFVLKGEQQMIVSSLGNGIVNLLDIVNRVKRTCPIPLSEEITTDTIEVTDRAHFDEEDFEQKRAVSSMTVVLSVTKL
ncbi:hypothetical protein PCE1_004743 [Barthelona sp. PCE]